MLTLLGTNERTFQSLYYVSQIYQPKTSSVMPGDYYLLTDFPFSQIIDDVAEKYMEDAKEIPPWVPNLPKFKKSLLIKKLVLPEGEPRLTSKGVKICRELELFFETDLFMVAPKTGLMQYSPHQLMFTSTQTGKSFVSTQTGDRFDTATVKSLMGFGTADKIMKGAIDGLMGTAVSIDEIPELLDEANYGELLNLLAQGNVQIAKGSAHFKYLCVSPFRFMGNPPNSPNEAIQEKGLYFHFERMLSKLTKNPLAFGSRFAGILFGLEYPSRKGAPINDLEGDYLNSLMIMNAKIKNGVKFVEEVKVNGEWLSKPYPAHYQDSIKGFISKAGTDSLKSFLTGHLLSNCHARGMALRASIIEDEDKEELFKEIMQINLKSFENIMGCSDSYSEAIHFERYSEHLNLLTAWVFRLMIEKKTPDIFWCEIPFGKITGLVSANVGECKRRVHKCLARFPNDFIVDDTGITVINPGVLNYTHSERFKGHPLFNVKLEVEKNVG